MSSAAVLTSPTEIRETMRIRTQNSLPPPASKVLFVHPRCFRITHPINVHMRDEFGKTHIVDSRVAEDQWQQLVVAYQNLGIPGYVINVDSQLPDMVFCANQTFPFMHPDGSKHVLLSEMRSTFRKPEVPFFETFFHEQGYRVHRQPTPPSFCFEGMGDVLPHLNGSLLLGGYGPRTDRAALDWIAHTCERPVIPLELPNPKFYHLDTCLTLLNATTAAACRDGFTAEGWKTLESLFATLIPIDPCEADSPGFAGNGHCPNGRDVLLQSGNSKTRRAFESAGFVVHELQTSEFIKAGGSVFCMKMMFF